MLCRLFVIFTIMNTSDARKWLEQPARRVYRPCVRIQAADWDTTDIQTRTRHGHTIQQRRSQDSGLWLIGESICCSIMWTTSISEVATFWGGRRHCYGVTGRIRLWGDRLVGSALWRILLIRCHLWRAELLLHLSVGGGTWWGKRNHKVYETERDREMCIGVCVYMYWRTNLSHQFEVT